MARDCNRRSQESFERSDTDGFLSQWAADVTAQLYRVCADVAERGGRWEFTVLADAQGNPIEGAREYKTRYGWAWRTPDGQWFNPSKARSQEARDRANLAKGFRFVVVEREAVVMMVEGGMWGCSPAVMPRHDRGEVSR
jgi:hypothetical protein